MGVLYGTLLFALISFLELALAQQDYQQKALDLHNKYRVQHHAPEMEMDNELNKKAVECAEYYATKGEIDHSCEMKKGAGENLAGGRGNWGQDSFAEMSVDMWYDEVKDYDYNNPGFHWKTGHFTQVVWKKSVKLGFGYANINGFTASVALYNPPGNYHGQFEENVLRP